MAAAQEKDNPLQKSYFDVLGLCCSSEVPLIENILKSLDGVKEFSVIVPSRTVIVVHDNLVISQLEIGTWFFITFSFPFIFFCTITFANHVSHLAFSSRSMHCIGFSVFWLSSYKITTLHICHFEGLYFLFYHHYYNYYLVI